MYLSEVRFLTESDSKKIDKTLDHGVRGKEGTMPRDQVSTFVITHHVPIFVNRQGCPRIHP